VASTQLTKGSGSPEAVTSLIEEHLCEVWRVFIKSASLWRNKDTADPVSSMISTATPPTFPLITVALFLTVATVGSLTRMTTAPGSHPLSFSLWAGSPSTALLTTSKAKSWIPDNCTVGGQPYYKESNI